jgi:excisionase family DNA binding protein
VTFSQTIDPALTYAEAAKYVNLSLRQFRRVFIDSGVLPIVRVSERRPRVRLSDLNTCLKSRTANFAPVESI